MDKRRNAEYLLLLTAVGVPLIVSPWSTDMHLLPKMLFASVMLAAAALWRLSEALILRRTVHVGSAVDGPLAVLVLAMLLSAAAAVDPSASWLGQYGHYTFGILGISLSV